MKNETREAFISFLRHEKGLCENTITHYLKPLMLMTKYCSNLLTLKNYQDVANLLIKIKTERNWCSRTTYKAASVSCVFYNWAARIGLMEESPMRLGHQFKKVENNRVEFFDWDSEDFKALFAHRLNTARDLAILHILRATGVRVSEIAALKIEDVDLINGFIKVEHGKGDKFRVVPFDEPCKDHLINYIKSLRRTNTLCLFPSRYHSTPIKAASIWKMINLRGKSIGVRAYPHKFRHSLAGRIIEGGGDIALAAEILGHSSLSSTKMYTHFRKEKSKDLYLKAIQ